MSSNLPLVCRSRRVLPFLFSMYGRGGRKWKINLPQRQIYANSKGGGAYKGRGRNVE